MAHLPSLTGVCKLEINNKDSIWENSNSTSSVWCVFEMSFGRELHENNFSNFWVSAHTRWKADSRAWISIFQLSNDLSFQLLQTYYETVSTKRKYTHNVWLRCKLVKCKNLVVRKYWYYFPREFAHRFSCTTPLGPFYGPFARTLGTENPVYSRGPITCLIRAFSKICYLTHNSGLVCTMKGINTAEKWDIGKFFNFKSATLLVFHLEFALILAAAHNVPVSQV